MLFVFVFIFVFIFVVVAFVDKVVVGWDECGDRERELVKKIWTAGGLLKEKLLKEMRVKKTDNV